MNLSQVYRRWRSQLLGVASAGLMPWVMSAGPAWGATSITAAYGIIEQSVSIDSLKAYAADGTINPDLRIFIRQLEPEQRESFKELLTARIDVSDVAISQFLYTAQGERLLQQVGQVIRTDAHLSGFYAIRAAVILAAADPTGLTLLNVFEKFPLDNIRIDLDRALQIAGELENLVQQSQVAVTLIQQQSTLDAVAQPWSPVPGSAELRSPGPFTWQMQTIQVDSASRQRSFPVDIYLPQPLSPQALQPAPVVVISHGLGGDRTTFAYLARQLASYGMVVAVPEHPGSDAQQIQALIAGTASQVTPASEFINRPLDITDLLDTLTSLSQSDPRFRGRMNLQQVGVVGQSFGGYTALALAGAQVNRAQLAAACGSQNQFNIALLLECQVLELPQPFPDLHDQRVTSILVINPIGRSLFGQSGFQAISIPVMMISSSGDTVAPALLEQIQPFTWLTAPERYLVLLNGGTHFSTINTAAASANALDLPSAVVGPNPAIAYTYLKAMGVAFFGTYSGQHPHYRDFLSAAYAKHINQSVMPIDLVRSLSLKQFQQIN